MNTCTYVLLYDKTCVILAAYLCRYKGGRCDLDGRKVTDSRGGSQENPQNAIHRKKVSERGCYTCNQTGRWYMAGERVRCKGLSRKADVQTRKVSWLFLPATPRKLHTSFHTYSSFPMQTLPVDDFTHGGRQLSMLLHAFL